MIFYLKPKKIWFNCLRDVNISEIRIPRVLHAFWLKGGGGHFEVKEGHPDFLQITWFFLNAVLLLYFKLFTCLEIITMLK